MLFKRLLIIGLMGFGVIPFAWADAPHPALSNTPDFPWETCLVATGFAGALAVALNHDTQIYANVQSWRTDWQDQSMPTLTLLGDGFVLAAGSAALYEFGHPRDQRVALVALEGQAFVAVLATVLKTVFSATRPAADPTHREWFTGVLSHNSFPSGHAMSAFCAAAIVGDAYHVEWLAYPLAALVGYSRIYNQRHWPADVVLGAGLGTLLGHLLVACHQQDLSESPVQIQAEPQTGGGRVTLSWSF